VVGNKADLEDQEAVDSEEVRVWAECLGALYAKASAKTAVGVEDFFQKLVLKLESGPNGDAQPRASVKLVPTAASAGDCRC